MTHCDMSDSEDGQLGSGKESADEEHDTDSLDIKPPQASIKHSHDPTGSRRKEKSNREKKHSKEKKHKTRSGRERERDIRVGAGSTSGGERERRCEVERQEQRRDDHADIERSYHSRGTYERDEREFLMLGNDDRRYQKQYDRLSESAASRGSNQAFHHPYHHQNQVQIQRQRQEYYEPRPNYHHGNISSIDYHGARHQQYVKYSSHVEYDHHDETIDIRKERKKYSYEQQQDAESLEQDLRSRLLSKRHKYVKGHEIEEQYEMHLERRDAERNESGYDDRERLAAKAERHKLRREKEKYNVIEVLDSPDFHEVSHQRRKHKRRKNKTYSDDAMVVEKRRSPDDPELLARRAKILAAEREKEKRKETAREELEARRERRKERGEAVDVLSPTAVAASVTAGLKVFKRKSKDNVEGNVKRKKRTKKAKDKSKYEEESDEDDDDDEDDSESASDSDAESIKSYTDNNSKLKSYKSKKNEDNSDSDVHMPESPFSIGELSKSPKRSKNKKKKHMSRSDNDDHDGDDDDDDDDDNIKHSLGSLSSSDERHSRSHSRSIRSQSQTRSHTSRSGSDDSDSHSASSVSRSRSRSRSQSHSLHSHSRSKSPSRSRSRTRSEERDMKANEQQAELESLKETDLKKPHKDDADIAPICDGKGVPLPNYYPGIQGCRSVEEFQCLNRIEEGTYGVVYRAKDKRTNEIVALKRLKMEKEKEGFPITSLREINTLLKGQHPNIVTVREIVVGSNMDKIFIVMDYVEHDLKSLMETMKNRKQSFFPGEVKCLTQQLLSAVGHLHDNWILHRDLKTSNLLLSHKGILKVGDFGLAREYGSPLKKYTSIVVTLWYRAPELLLCSPEYSTPIDIWSVGCIFAEFLQMAPLFPGKSEIDELNKIFKELGTPNEKIWPGYKDLPAVKNLLSQNSQFADYPVSNIRKRFADKTSESGISLLQGLLTYDPKQRLTADGALKHPYFKEIPLPIDPSMFPTWPAKSELGARKAMASSPKPPSGGSQFKQLGRDDVVAGGSSNKIMSGIITGNKKTAANTGFVLNAGFDQRQLSMGPGFSLKF